MNSEPTTATFLAANRGGGLLTETVDQRFGARFALAGYRLQLSPTVLTMGNLIVGLATSITVAAFAESMAEGRVSSVPIGLGALLFWHVAYWFDCADGQLARVAGKTSAAGAQVDILVDVAVQIALVSAVSAVAIHYSPKTPGWFVATFAGCWMINLVTSVLSKGDDGPSLIASRSPLIRLVKLSRDFSAMITLIALVIAFVPRWTVWVMLAFTLLNGLFLLATIAATARLGLKATAVTANPTKEH